VQSALPTVQAASGAVLAADAAIQSRKQSGQPPTTAFLGGLQDVFKEPEKSRNAMLMIVIIGLGVLLFFVFLRRK
jgi:hypothetical protein